MFKRKRDCVEYEEQLVQFFKNDLVTSANYCLSSSEIYRQFIDRYHLPIPEPTFYHVLGNNIRTFHSGAKKNRTLRWNLTLTPSDPIPETHYLVPDVIVNSVIIVAPVVDLPPPVSLLTRIPTSFSEIGLHDENEMSMDCGGGGGSVFDPTFEKYLRDDSATLDGDSDFDDFLKQFEMTDLQFQQTQNTLIGLIDEDIKRNPMTETTKETTTETTKKRAEKNYRKHNENNCH